MSAVQIIVVLNLIVIAFWIGFDQGHRAAHRFFRRLSDTGERRG